MDALLGLLPGGSPTAVLAAVGAVLLLFWRIFAAGKTSERLKQSQAEAKARDIADEVDNDVGAVPPAEAREELKRW